MPHPNSPDIDDIYFGRALRGKEDLPYLLDRRLGA
jgi:hypothetical protein